MFAEAQLEAELEAERERLAAAKIKLQEQNCHLNQARSLVQQGQRQRHHVQANKLLQVTIK